ncbi:MAG: alpha/beta hydrolase [Herpetosiphon sp.]
MPSNESDRNGFAPINGAEMWYEIIGTGHPLVLVHAGIADHRMWDDQVATFARSYQVIRYDMRGFGATKMVTGPYSHADDLYALLRFLDVDRSYVLGCSMGGSTAIDLALEHPDLVSALILVAPSVSGYQHTGPLPSQWPAIEAACNAGDFDRASELEVQVWVDGPQRTPEQVDPRIRAKVHAMNLISLATPEGLGIFESHTAPAVNRLSELHLRTLVIVGDLDQPAIIGIGDIVARDIEGAQKTVIRGTAHLPNMEQPSEFNRVVVDFLATLI